MTSTAKANAVKLIENYCFESPRDIELENLLYNEGMYLREERLYCCDGRIAFTENHGVITIDKNIKDENHKRFLISHEMGHFYNERGKGTKLHIEKNNLHNSTDLNEIRANAFAAELLMHEPWFKEYCDDVRITRELFTGIAEDFMVTLTAGAVRYSELGNIPAAVILSTRGKVEWSSINEYFPFQNCQRGFQVQENSYAYSIHEKFEIERSLSRNKHFYKKRIDFNELKIGYEKAKRINLVAAAAWFSGSFKSICGHFVNEMNFPMPKYDSVLTILWERG